MRVLQAVQAPPASVPQWTDCGERAQSAVTGSPFHRWTFPDGTLWTEFFRQGSDYLLRFPDLADFKIDGAGKTILGWRAPGASQAALEHLYLNQALPLALSRQGRFVLHASAVDLGEHCVAFLGPSGRGKSTLAASFAANASRFLTDDGLRLEWQDACLMALPSHPSLRLWEDSRRAVTGEGAVLAPSLEYTDKSRLLAGQALPHRPEPLPIRAFYFLGEDPALNCQATPLRPMDAALQLVRNSFLLDTEEREMLARHFDEVSRIAALPIHFQFDYPRRYDALPAVRDYIARHAAGDAPLP